MSGNHSQSMNNQLQQKDQMTEVNIMATEINDKSCIKPSGAAILFCFQETQMHYISWDALPITMTWLQSPLVHYTREGRSYWKQPWPLSQKQCIFAKFGESKEIRAIVNITSVLPRELIKMQHPHTPQRLWKVTRKISNYLTGFSTTKSVPTNTF